MLGENLLSNYQISNRSAFCELAVPAITKNVTALPKKTSNHMLPILPPAIAAGPVAQHLGYLTQLNSQQFNLMLYYELLKRGVECLTSPYLNTRADTKPMQFPVHSPGLKINPTSLFKEYTRKDQPLSPTDSIKNLKASHKTNNQPPIEEKKPPSAALVKAQSRKRKRKDKTAAESEHDKSPISGILIKRVKHQQKSSEKEEEAGRLSVEKTDEAGVVKSGDIDSKYNFVDKSEESRKKLSEIQNVIGDFVCQLCRGKFTDAYGLAEHRCPSIIYIEYKCPECLKVFNCPANLASHRRWHKPKPSKNACPSTDNSKDSKKRMQQEEILIVDVD